MVDIGLGKGIPDRAIARFAVRIHTARRIAISDAVEPDMTSQTLRRFSNVSLLYPKFFDCVKPNTLIIVFCVTVLEA